MLLLTLKAMAQMATKKMEIAAFPMIPLRSELSDEEEGAQQKRDLRYADSIKRDKRRGGHRDALSTTMANNHATPDPEGNGPNGNKENGDSSLPYDQKRDLRYADSIKRDKRRGGHRDAYSSHHTLFLSRMTTHPSFVDTEEKGMMG
jgi:hypothetical protein